MPWGINLHAATIEPVRSGAYTSQRRPNTAKKKKPVNYLAVRNVSGMTSQAEDTVSAKALRQR